MKVLVIAEDGCAADVVRDVACRATEVLVLCRKAECAMEVSIAASEAGCDCISSRSDTRLTAAAAEFAPNLVFHVPELSSFDLGAKGTNGEAHSCRMVSLRIGSGPEPEFTAIENNAKSLTCGWFEGSEALVPPIEVPLHEFDTAISLRYKNMSAAKRMKAGALAKAFETQMNGASPSRRRSSSNSMKDAREIGKTWDEDRVRRFVRATTFPPHPPAIAKMPTGERYAIETSEQYSRLQRRANGSESPTGRGTKRGYAADTHWYSNVGGSIVKISARAADDPTLLSDTTIEEVPGAASAGMRKKLRMNEPVIGPNALRYCQDALASTWIGVEGPFVKKFERALARIAGCEQACAVHSGTAALYGALKALGVDNTDHHVIVPTYTCSACADGVVHTGGTPISVDCERDTFGLDFESVKSAIEADPKMVGVVIAPCYGIPSRDFHKIWELCQAKGIWLCEDNCESYGAMMRASGDSDTLVPVGAVGTICVVSVRSEKMIGVGEGGAILSRDPNLVAKARWWCSRAPTRGAGLWRVYEHDDVGQNYRLPEMLAAVGLASAECLPANIDRKVRIHDLYAESFEGSGFRLQSPEPIVKPVWWLNAVQLPDDAKCSAEEVGHQIMTNHPEIEVRPAFFPLHWMAPFKDAARPCPNAEYLYKCLFCLPSSAQLEDADIRHIAASAIEAYKQKTA